ncbi:MAG: TPM domain-containing protein [Bacteroidales bacterium]|jgi:uncharacterized protein|nr:TPM domain-containing protein [Bacteroidales bacterium]
MRKLLLIWMLCWLPAAMLPAQDIPEKPDPPRLVNDLANVLSATQTQQLEDELEEYARGTSTQIVIVTVPSLNGYPIADYTFKLGEKWGVGQKGKNNGVVIVFKPKTERESGEVFVAVGYGLEGVIPDAVASRTIVRQEMLPRFREGDIFGGLNNACKVIMALAAKEFTWQEYEAQHGENSALAFLPLLLLIIVFVIVQVARRKNLDMGTKNLAGWWLLSSLLNSGGKDSNWDDFTHGGGGFGGNSGGFGGFGGGSFGGGGAGGRW